MKVNLREKTKDQLSKKDYSACLFRIPENGARVIWEITNTCNYSCSYCIFSSEFKHQPNELETVEVLKVIDELKEANFTHLKITGGEPFIRRDLIHILEYAIQLGFYVDVSTNASLINEERAVKLKEMGLPLVHVSLDGPTEFLHDKVRGKGTFLATLKGIEKLVRNKLYVRIGCLLYKDNQDQIGPMIEHCIKLGVNEVVFSRMEPVGRMKGNNSLLATANDKDLQNQLKDYKRKYASQIKINGNFSENKKETGCSSCPGGDKFLYIDHQGKLSPCTWISQYFNHYSPKKSLHEETFSNLLGSSEIKSYLTLTKSLYQKGLTGCPAKMHQQVRDYENISNLFKGDFSDSLKQKAKFSKFSPIYSFTTENISAYFPQFDFLGKNILTVGSSGDHLFNSLFLGAEKVTCFDSNLLARFYVELKWAALKKLSFIEFKDFLLRNAVKNKNTLSHQIYLKLKPEISDLAQVFFDEAYAYFKEDGWLLRESSLFNNKYDHSQNKLAYNLYLKNEETYRKTQASLNGKKLEWISEYLQFIPKNKSLNSRKFDLILLSNISDYAHKMYSGENYLEQFKERIITPLLSMLNSDGTLSIGYLYNCSKKHYRTEIDKPEIRKKIFQFKNHEYQEIAFPSVIEGNDLILTLK